MGVQAVEAQVSAGIERPDPARGFDSQPQGRQHRHADCDNAGGADRFLGKRFDRKIESGGLQAGLLERGQRPGKAERLVTHLIGRQ